MESWNVVQNFLLPEPDDRKDREAVVIFRLSRSNRNNIILLIFSKVVKGSASENGPTDFRYGCTSLKQRKRPPEH